MKAKLFLPILGGVPAVWTGCMVFYQIVLLLGYLYAHGLSMLSLKKQILIHGCLLIFSIFCMFTTNHSDNDFLVSLQNYPLIWLFVALLISIGPMFFVLSSTSPLMLNWFRQSTFKTSLSPYPLYAAGNVGSLVAIIIFPTLVEPMLKMSSQNSLWSVGYVLLVSLISIVLIFLIFINQIKPEELEDAKIEKDHIIKPSEVLWRSHFSSHKNVQRLNWILYSFIPSSLLLGLTSYITNDVAPVPYFWAIPLLLYIFSFVIVFTSWSSNADRLVSYLLPLTMVVILLCFKSYLWVSLVLHVVFFLVASLACHGRLFLLKPHPTQLTEFFFFISLGGALGGFFNSLLAPILFNQILEYQLVILMALVACMPIGSKKLENHRLRIIFYTTVVSFVFAITIFMSLGFIFSFDNVSFVLSEIKDVSLLSVNKLYLLFLMLLSLPIFYYFRKNADLNYGYFLGIFISANFVLFFYKDNFSNIVFRDRSFFGVLKVVQKQSVNRLRSGEILHGEQDLETNVSRKMPLSYYHRQGPLGDIWNADLEEISNLRVGAIGLGVGTVAAYGSDKSSITFYELNPNVEKLARNEKLFTYMSDCLERNCKLKVVLGDGRLQMTKNSETYDLIILDAFSSDAIPVHLITMEAFQIYLSKLNESGTLAIHISNRYVNLEPVIKNITNKLSLYSLIKTDKRDGSISKSPSIWVMINRKKEIQESFVNRFKGWKELSSKENVGIWSDDYVNLFSVLKMR